MESALKAEAERRLATYQGLVTDVRAHLAAVTAVYDRLAEANTAVEQAGRAWSAAREARDALPGNAALGTVADQAEEAYFAADAGHRDLLAETGPAQERHLAAVAAASAAGLAFRSAQDAYFAALARGR